MFLFFCRGAGRGGGVRLRIDHHIAQKALGHGVGEPDGHSQNRADTGQTLAAEEASFRGARTARRNDAKSKSENASYQTASLSFLAARKATFLLALMWIASPVAGLRPMRAARLRTCRMPRPTMRMRSPFFRCLVIRPTRSFRMASACFLDNSCSSAMAAARCLSVTVVGVAAFFAIFGPPRCWWLRNLRRIRH